MLSDGDQIELRRDSITVFDKDGRPVVRPRTVVDAGNENYDKGGFAHYMLKEINEQPAVARIIEVATTPKGSSSPMWRSISTMSTASG